MEEAPEKPFWNVVTIDGRGYVFETKDWAADPNEDGYIFRNRNEDKFIEFWNPMVVEYVGD